MDDPATGTAARGEDGTRVRQMGLDDLDAAIAVVDAANAGRVAAGQVPQPEPRSEVQLQQLRRSHARFVQRDGPGAWVAVADGRVVGVAESVRRAHFWGLSMLFVHPDFQSRGIGAGLLEAALSYGDGANQRMIVSSPDPRALRRYFLAGLEMHPAADVAGRPDRTAIPSALPGRSGGEDDLDLVAAVEARLGRSRTEDVAFMLRDDRFRLDIVDRGTARGWAVWRPGRLVMLGATDEQTARVLVWRHFAECDEETSISTVTAEQQWLVAVAHEARLAVKVEGALFVGGMSVPGPWLPSGWYF